MQIFVFMWNMNEFTLKHDKDDLDKNVDCETLYLIIVYLFSDPQQLM